MTDVVADFSADILIKDLDQIRPVKGRVLLNREQLVLVTKNIKKTIVLSEIVSVHAGSISDKLSMFFDEVINVIYKINNNTQRAIIGSSPETVSKFTKILFKILIGKETVFVKHPDKMGGRVVNDSPEKMTLYLKGSTIKLESDHYQDSISSDIVIGFKHVQRQIRGEARPALVLDYIAGDTTLTTCISLLSERKLKLLSRFARIEYDETNRDLNLTELGDIEMWSLVELYTHGKIDVLDKIKGKDQLKRDEIIDNIRNKNLVEKENKDLHLTYRGKIAVNRYYSD